MQPLLHTPPAAPFDCCFFLWQCLHCMQPMPQVLFMASQQPGYRFPGTWNSLPLHCLIVGFSGTMLASWAAWCKQVLCLCWPTGSTRFPLSRKWHCKKLKNSSSGQWQLERIKRTSREWHLESSVPRVASGEWHCGIGMIKRRSEKGKSGIVQLSAKNKKTKNQLCKWEDKIPQQSTKGSNSRKK